MSLLLLSHPECDGHDVGRGHPERPERTASVLAAVRSSAWRDAIVERPAPLVAREVLLGSHDPRLLDAVESGSAAGHFRFDADTEVVGGSWMAAQRAAGAGLAAVEALRAGAADAAFCVVRPPGHHATPQRAMGFCLFNNVAVTARALADQGESVVVLDWDAHHGNGTQAACELDERIALVSIHEWPQYPGTGRVDDHGPFANVVNVPVPAGTTGTTYRAVVDDVLAPFVEQRHATWLLISAGFDSHRADPLTQLGLVAADFADLARATAGLVPQGRTIAFLEGGYDLAALGESAAACISGLVGEGFTGERSSPRGADEAAARAVARARRFVADGE